MAAASEAVWRCRSAAPGMYTRLAGEEEERARTFGELQWAAALALLLLFMVLAGTFESLIHPLTVVAVGAAVADRCRRGPGSARSTDRYDGDAGDHRARRRRGQRRDPAASTAARRLMAQGMPRVDALARASGLRWRPILMTTATTVLALLPLAMGTGEAARLRSTAGADRDRRDRGVDHRVAAGDSEPVSGARSTAAGQAMNLFRIPVRRPVATAMFFSSAVSLLGFIAWNAHSRRVDAGARPAIACS